ncbi:MAG: pyruvate:ferredoxin (flavodoxin) oxidoreductase [Anaerolineaceae bacterium]|nr:pyruvate:ferredoxin (flavodoxin) oxidoreductase [Anaerolineaceae bacterium]
MNRELVMTDANEATAYVAYRLSEVIAIYPITPSSTMGEFADQWMAERVPNIWGTIPSVNEMQSEGGAAGAIHGALQAGALSSTFTASQGLLLMIPNMYKIAGELTPTVFHVSARSLAAQALSIFGDHQDVMATRQTGWALLSSNSVQEAQDMAAIATASTLRSRVPFLHFFDGFRTSHEINKMERLSDEDLRQLISQDMIFEHRKRALSPDHPVLRGSAQNPDVYFQGRETVNVVYDEVERIVSEEMERFADLTGRQYHTVEYFGAKDAEKVIVIMGSGVETAAETAAFLNKKGEKLGVIDVRLFRPFPTESFVKALPATVKKIAVLDRTKESGAIGEPLFLDVVNALRAGEDLGISSFKKMPLVIGGRYGLSSKDFSPAMVKAVYDELGSDKPRRQFTVGIHDDVSKLSIPFDSSFEILPEKMVQAVFFGLGSDGTVGANKNSIKIIGIETPNYAQGYFEYDSKKSGGITISHLRFGPQPIKAPYFIAQGEANFIGCHQVSFVDRYDMLKYARPGSVFLLNSIYGPDKVWDTLPREMQKDLIEKKVRFYVIDAYDVAEKAGMGNRINTIMQTCFFAISGVLPRDEAIEAIKNSIYKTYHKKGEAIVKKNYDAVDASIANMHEVKVPAKVSTSFGRKPAVPAEAPEFVRETLGAIIDLKGDSVPVSQMPNDGTFPTATTKWEKRNIALEIPVWNPQLCIQCAKCAFVCPHAAIRTKIYKNEVLEKAPESFKHVFSKSGNWKDGYSFTVQVAPEDCTGCGLCVENCPGKDRSDPKVHAIMMNPQPPLREQEAKNFSFFLDIPYMDRADVPLTTIKNSQMFEPLFEFSGACGGCGETPYVRLVSQLFGDRMIVANATGCSSIYGGNLPTTPWAVNGQGRGPAWANSLFEDNAEFGMGMRLTLDKFNEFAKELLEKHAASVGKELADEILNASQKTEGEIRDQRERVAKLKKKLEGKNEDDLRQLLSLADYLVRKTVWIIGGDGWAYDIGYGGLDHVLASGRDINVLVLDTEVYSNTGGQSSKATPRGAVAKFAAYGKDKPKKDLGQIAMTYGNIYVARVAMGYNDGQVLKALVEADSYEGPSLVIAYSHCISHGIDMKKGLIQQKAAVNSGAWITYRYDPRLVEEGKNPLQLDSKAPTVPVADYAYQENRYRMLLQSDEQRAEDLMRAAQMDAERRWKIYEQMAAMEYSKAETPIEVKDPEIGKPESREPSEKAAKIAKDEAMVSKDAIGSNVDPSKNKKETEPHAGPHKTGDSQ